MKELRGVGLADHFLVVPPVHRNVHFGVTRKDKRLDHPGASAKGRYVPWIKGYGYRGLTADIALLRIAAMEDRRITRMEGDCEEEERLSANGRQYTRMNRHAEAQRHNAA
jgi:hypothetical protein